MTEKDIHNLRTALTEVLEETQLTQIRDTKKAVRNTVLTYVGGLALVVSVLLINMTIKVAKQVDVNKHSTAQNDQRINFLEYHTGKIAIKVLGYNPFYESPKN